MSNRGGQATFKGINYQAMAAISLFLQNYTFADFKHIAFEQEKLKDFDLVFEKKKIICESKALKITHGVLRQILDDLINNERVNQLDEILIICNSVSKNLKTDLEYYKYLDESLKRLKLSKFSESHIELLQKVKFWDIDSNINRKVVESLFAQAVGIWVSETSFNDMLSNILLNNIYHRSEKGGIFTKEEFVSLLDKRKAEITSDSVYYNDSDAQIAKIQNVLMSVSDPKSKAWLNKELAALTASPMLYFYAIKQFQNRKDLKLQEWDMLWKAATKGTFSLQVFDIFKDNIEDIDNQNYIIFLLPQILDNIVNFYRVSYVIADSAHICENILKRTRLYDREIFEVITKLFDKKLSDSFYVKNLVDRDDWERGEISRTLRELYVHTDNQDICDEIISFIFKNFNLIIEEGEFYHRTPKEIFEILHLHAVRNNSFENNLINLINSFVDQYVSYYKKFGKGLEYKGWEHMGSDRDKHIVTDVIQPALDQYYNFNRVQCWSFILNNISTTEKDVTSTKPDFVNRAVLPIVLKEYMSEDNKEIAYQILSDFIRMRQGIPSKRELIFRSLLSFEIDDQRIWDLVNVQLSIKAFRSLPANAFVKQLVTNLANKGDKKALAYLIKWTKSPKFYRFNGTLDHNINSTLIDLLKSEQTYKVGVSILDNFLNTNEFKYKMDQWSVWKLASVFADVLDKDAAYSSTLDRIWNQKKLTKNEQTFITSVLNDIKNPKTLEMIYEARVSFWLTDCSDNVSKFIKKVPLVGPRINFVQYADKLADAGLYSAAIRIANMFVEDPDPLNDNDKDDPKGEENYHLLIKKGEEVNQITTVRGYVCWVLQKISVLKGREYIPQIIELVDKLTKDKNYYVRAYSCIALQQLAQIRHTVLPTDRNERFISFKHAQEIEEIAFNMLRHPENWKLRQIMISLIHVFSNIRALNELQAKEVLNIFLDTKDDKVIEELVPLLIFFAEFRMNAIQKGTAEKTYGKEQYLSLIEFDQQYFKDLLESVIKDANSNIKTTLVWHFWKLPKQNEIEYEKSFEISLRYLALLISDYDHEVYNRVYYFIEENIDNKPSECILLWKKCIASEKQFICKNYSPEKLHDMHWWPYHHNGEILVNILNREGVDSFLVSLSDLLDYPQDMLIGEDFNLVVDALIDLPITDITKNLFEKIVVRSPQYYEKMTAWIGNAD